MSASNEIRECEDSPGSAKGEISACGPECGCNTTGASGRIRWMLGAAVLAAAVVMAARAVTKSNAVPSRESSSGFTTGQSAGGIVSTRNGVRAATDAIGGREINALSELNTVAADTNAVFVVLPEKDGKPGDAAMTQIQNAVRTLEARGGRLGVFTLKPGARDYELLTAQVAVPGVLTMIKGRGMAAVSGEVTEAKLIQAFVGASRAGGCGPASGSGCCPKPK